MFGLSPAEAQARIKHVVTVCDGNVTNAAAMLGISKGFLSKKLNHRGLLQWWEKYKAKRSQERAKAGRRRAYLRERTRALIESGYDPETAAALAAVPYVRDVFPGRRGRRE